MSECERKIVPLQPKTYKQGDCHEHLYRFGAAASFFCIQLYSSLWASACLPILFSVSLGRQSLLPMDEEKPKKKRKKAVAADDGAGEHKRLLAIENDSDG